MERLLAFDLAIEETMQAYGAQLGTALYLDRWQYKASPYYKCAITAQDLTVAFEPRCWYFAQPGVPIAPTTEG